MHVENIRCLEEKLAALAVEYMDNGAENVDTDEMGKVVDMLKDLASAEKDARIAVAMEESGEDIASYHEGYMPVVRNHHAEATSAKHATSISDVFSDMERIVNDIAKDMTAEEKTKYKARLQGLMQKIQ